MGERFRLQKLHSGKVSFFRAGGIGKDFDFGSVALARIHIVQYGAVLVRAELCDGISGVYEYPTVCEPDDRTAIIDDLSVGNLERQRKVEKRNG